MAKCGAGWTQTYDRSHQHVAAEYYFRVGLCHRNRVINYKAEYDARDNGGCVGGCSCPLCACRSVSNTASGGRVGETASSYTQLFAIQSLAHTAPVCMCVSVPASSHTTTERLNTATPWALPLLLALHPQPAHLVSVLFHPN